MPRPTITRPRSALEKPWPWLILSTLLALLFVALAFLGIRYIQAEVDDTQRPMFLLIVLLGFVALALIIVAFFYSIRKRVLQERLGGTMMSWLKSHVYLGALALVTALAHAFLFPLNTTFTSGKIALFLLLLLVVSGALWRLVYMRVPPQVAEQVGNLSIRDTRERVASATIELEKIKVGKSRQFQQAVDDLVYRRRPLPEIEGMLVGVDVSERATWDRVKEISLRFEIESAREDRQRRFARFMQGWRIIHLPLAALLLGSVAFHLVDVFNVSRVFAGEPQKQFAGAEECATCHASIVEEWKESMHRDAQTSTITVAQTKLALQKNEENLANNPSLDPDIEFVCVNCHAPIAINFSQSALFPVVEPDPGDNPVEVEDEGVTCIVCHTRETPPEELEGAQIGGAKLEIGKRGSVSFGTMFGPDLEPPDTVPASVHDSEVGFMTSERDSSQMCGACHNVIADMDGDGIVGSNAQAREEALQRGELEENVLDFEDDDNDGDLDLQDLALQTTFNEWENYLNQGGVRTCVECHMPAVREPAVDSGPPALGAPERDRNKHIFVGVDYDLNEEYYEQEGMPEDALAKALEERETLLKQSVSIQVDVGQPEGGLVQANVTIRNNTGHSFPTGFAFARQFWLEVTATTAGGQPACLANIDATVGAEVTPLVDENGQPVTLPAKCTSGEIGAPAEELPTCDLNNIPGLLIQEDKIAHTVSFGPQQCDPWLTNWQKILTDGDPDGDGTFTEVPYQSFLRDIVKKRVRPFGGITCQSDPDVVKFVMDEILPLDACTYPFVFQSNEQIDVTVTLKHRHLPPYFVRGLDDFYPEDITADGLLENMTVVDIASNKGLPEVSTDPDPATLAAKIDPPKEKKTVAVGVAPPDEPPGGTIIVASLFAFALVAGIGRARRRT